MPHTYSQAVAARTALESLGRHHGSRPTDDLGRADDKHSRSTHGKLVPRFHAQNEARASGTRTYMRQMARHVRRMPEIIRRLRLRERRPTCARMGSEESTLQAGIVGTCANVEYRVSDAMRGPFRLPSLPSIHISHLRCDRCAFVNRGVCSVCSSWSTQQGPPPYRRRWSSPTAETVRRGHAPLQVAFTPLASHFLFTPYEHLLPFAVPCYAMLSKACAALDASIRHSGFVFFAGARGCSRHDCMR